MAVKCGDRGRGVPACHVLTTIVTMSNVTNIGGRSFLSLNLRARWFNGHLWSGLFRPNLIEQRAQFEPAIEWPRPVLFIAQQAGDGLRAAH